MVTGVLKTWKSVCFQKSTSLCKTFKRIDDTFLGIVLIILKYSYC